MAKNDATQTRAESQPSAARQTHQTRAESLNTTHDDPPTPEKSDPADNLTAHAGDVPVTVPEADTRELLSAATPDDRGYRHHDFFEATSERKGYTGPNRTHRDD